MKIEVTAHPGSKNPRIIKESKNKFIVYVSKPAAKGEANKAIIEMLSIEIGIPKTFINLISGETSKFKCFEIEGYREDDLLV